MLRWENGQECPCYVGKTGSSARARCVEATSEGEYKAFGEPDRPRW